METSYRCAYTIVPTQTTEPFSYLQIVTTSRAKLELFALPQQDETEFVYPEISVVAICLNNSGKMENDNNHMFRYKSSEFHKLNMELKNIYANGDKAQNDSLPLPLERSNDPPLIDDFDTEPMKSKITHVPEWDSDIPLGRRASSLNQY